MGWLTRVLALFGGKKLFPRIEAPSSGPPPDHPGQPIVSWSAVEAAQSGGDHYALVQAIVDFVNAMSHQGLYANSEIAGNAVQAYNADYYLAQVENGGHSQFIHNSRANASTTWPGALAGLRASGARRQARLLQKMIAWAEANPDDADEQTGFNGGRDDTLDRLDYGFFAAEKKSPILESMARWILTWPDLYVVDDPGYPATIDRVAMANPQRGARQVARRIGMLDHQINDWLHVALGMAAAASSENEICLGIGGGSIDVVEGERRLAWLVHTNAGHRFGVLTDEHVRLYERVGPPIRPAPDVWDADALAASPGLGRNAARPTCGRRLAHVDCERIREVVGLANRCRSAAAIDLVLRKTGKLSDDVVLSAVEGTDGDPANQASGTEAGPPQVRWAVAVDNNVLLALTRADSASLFRPTIANRWSRSALRRSPATPNNMPTRVGSAGRICRIVATQVLMATRQ